ncbi:hypothetical protein CPT_Mulock_056 [Klebsiella phage Mulock]|nr:hypothetical protein CPT_Mulock_056 [Klebsiella phage Mulock]
MTKSTITREESVQAVFDLKVGYRLGFADIEILKRVARMALAAMDGEPVALQPELAKVIYHFRDWNEGFPVERFKADYVISWMLANYPPAPPVPERDQVRSAHAEWSQATFGNVGPVGPLKHLSKEALEAAEQPGDLSEWADMQFLMWDAQRRAGITDEQITQAMIEKLAVNKQRKWPEPKDGEPRLHIKEQPAPIASVCTCPSGDGSLRWPCPVHPGKSPAQSDCCPAQSDCCPAQNSVNPEQSPIDHGYRPECECSGCKATARICTEMAVNSLVIPNEMTSEQAYEIGYYYGDPVNVFARGANWMRQHIIDSTLAAAPQETNS